ncbi:MAG: VCBS repeat-containing protein, partial [Planctomycetes bacterium]|nr:VCBS repeat-containing protein [Planctomycetota bacterium]
FLANGENTFQKELPLMFEPMIGPKGKISLICADLNNDGFEDAIFAGADSSQPGIATRQKILAVAMADKTGRFEAPEFKLLPGIPRSYSGGTDLVASDFDQDGKLDLALALAGRDSIMLYRGDGTGALDLYRSYGVGYYPKGLTLLDMNKDEVIDLVAAEPIQEKFSLLMGVLKPMKPAREDCLQCGVDFFLESHPTLLKTGDFNMDDLQDLVILDDKADRLSILLGNGNPLFVPNEIISLSGGAPRSLTVFQANADEDVFPDLALITSIRPDFPGTLRVYFNDGNGRFSEGLTENLLLDPRAVQAGDVNNDGAIDLVVTHGLGSGNEIFFGDGKGVFDNTFFSNELKAPEGLFLNDFDIDYDLDAVLPAPTEGVLYIVPNDSKDTPINPASELFSTINVRGIPKTVAIGDFSLDLFPDIAVGIQGEPQCYLYKNDESAHFGYQGTVALAEPAGFLLGKDIDFNHETDLIATLPGLKGVEIILNHQGLLFGSEDGTFPVNSFDSEAQPLWVDLNGDFLPELIVPSLREKKLTILFNQSQ